MPLGVRSPSAVTWSRHTSCNPGSVGAGCIYASQSGHLTQSRLKDMRGGPACLTACAWKASQHRVGTSAHWPGLGALLMSRPMQCRQPSSPGTELGLLFSHSDAHSLLRVPHSLGGGRRRPCSAGALGSHPRPGAKAGAHGCPQLDLLVSCTPSGAPLICCCREVPIAVLHV